MRGLARTDAAPDAFATWSGRLLTLAHHHAEVVGGRVHPTAFDPVMVSFSSAEAAMTSLWALWDEIESTRTGHRHGGLLGIGVAAGPALHDHGALLGPPVARALRLALLAEERGEVLVDDSVFKQGLPVGFGAHKAKGDRLGFPYHHVADYR